MVTYLALLRAINLGGSTRLLMTDLRRVVERVGFTDVCTVGQSGNVVFRGAGNATRQIERRIEGALSAAPGIHTEVFVRSADEWKALVDGNPFRAEARADPAHLTLWLLKDAAPADAATQLRARVVGRERFRMAGRSAYIVYPDGIGTSRITAAVVERALVTRTTARNWNTVIRLADLSSGRGN